MIPKKDVASAVGGKTVRACDGCLRNRARWYCAADDAFLCQVCDSSVHSANPLARRHERVRLKTASLKSLDLVSKGDSNCVPSWHRGFTRKARTPRHNKAASHFKAEDVIRNPFPLVPEVGSDELSHEDYEEEQLLYRVPIFDPCVAELCTTPTTTTISNDAEAGNTIGTPPADGRTESKASLTAATGNNHGHEVEGLHGFLPSETDLAEFAADVESLLGRGLENESFGMEELGLMDRREENTEDSQRECCLGSGRVKLEEEEATRIEQEGEGDAEECHGDTELDMTREPTFQLSFDYDSPATCEEEDEKIPVTGRESDLKLMKKDSEECQDDNGGKKKKKKKKKKRKILQLNLDYEGVISAWASQGSPWTTGDRPEVDPDECWPDCMGACGTEAHHTFGYRAGLGGQPGMGDGGREARVSRYREKRRTRLFSKKIRYEVRKLNAEKRPRMKGRFVKRTCFAPPAFPLINK